MTLVYRCNDETAEWVAKNSGTTAKSLTKLEEVETDGYGAETWKGRRMIGQEEDYYIPVNRVLAVEERVGIMQTMFELSRVYLHAGFLFNVFIHFRPALKRSRIMFRIV